MIFDSNLKKSAFILCFGVFFLWAQIAVLEHDVEHEHDEHHEVVESCATLLATKIDECESSDFVLETVAIAPAVIATTDLSSFRYDHLADSV